MQIKPVACSKCKSSPKNSNHNGGGGASFSFSYHKSTSEVKHMNIIA